MKRIITKIKLIAMIIMAKHGTVLLSNREMNDIKSLKMYTKMVAEKTGKYVHLEVAESDGREIVNIEYNN